MDRPLRVVLGITGGIAAYKAPELTRLLTRKGMQVRVVLTPNARGFVGEEALQTVSNHPVYADSPNPQIAKQLYSEGMDHISLAAWGDVFLIAPATANTIAKITHGIADNLLTSLALVFGPHKTICAPAMNTGMWDNPATVANVALLKKRGVTILDVDEGELACGDNGKGRMIGIGAIVDSVLDFFVPKLLKNKRVLISCGPTQEPIDPVRVITNRSSGIMGCALASAARAMGAQVHMVCGPLSVDIPTGVPVTPIITARQMREEMLARFGDSDLCIMAAAVADFAPETVAVEKIARETEGGVILTLTPNPDIAAELGRIKKNQFLIGFALQDTLDIPRAREKMAAKLCDGMVLNAKTALDASTTEIVVLDKNGAIHHCGPDTKEHAARVILSLVARSAGWTNG
jgi:phosphopantothenoylcysteine decarboxylase/phosphopantothenate--cysteine ligase